MTKKAMAFEENDNMAFDTEEAHFYHTIASFEDLIDEYGFEQIMENINDDAYIQMFDFFVPALDDDE